MRAGDSVGDYVLQRRLGEGGMGAVWLATDAAGDEVALKLMRDVEAHFERFAREVEVLQSLEHPGIVRARSGLGRDGEHVYYAMDYVAGRSLETLLADDRALGPRAAVEVCLGLLEALEAAHAEGVVHRDVKPGNVLVDAEGVPRLVDFGLSLAQDRTRLTAAGTVMGTPAYMSPEQARGAEAGPAADLYAVGVLLFELLAGQPPFRASNPVALLRAHMDDEPPDLGTLVPGLDEGLVQLVQAALAKRPEDRPASAGAMASALRALTTQAGQASTVVLQARLASTRELRAPAPAARSAGKASTQPRSGPASEAPTLPPAPRARWPLVGAALALALAVGLGLTLRPGAEATSAAVEPPPGVRLQLLDGSELSGTLEAINAETHTLVLRGEDGELRSLSTADVVQIRHVDPAPAGQNAPGDAPR